MYNLDPNRRHHEALNEEGLIGDFIHVKTGPAYSKGHAVRTIPVGSEGIKAHYDVDAKRIISYLFPKDGWTYGKAKAWVEKHEGKTRSLRESGGERYEIELPGAFSEYFSRIPESGMGYHSVDLLLRNGTTVSDCTILNGTKLVLPEGSREIRPLEIEEIVPKPRKTNTLFTLPDDFLSEASSTTSRQLPKVILPRRLPRGGTIGITAPSSNVPAGKVARGIKYLKEWGYQVKLGATVVAILDQEMTAGSDRARAQDLMNMFQDPAVDAVLTATGGYGSSRLLRYLDFDVFRKNPKPLSGFSDTTALLNAITLETGLVTFLGPTAEIREDNESTATKYLSLLLGLWSKPREGYEVVFPPEISLIRRLPTAATTTPASGRLFGGNLTLVSRLCGTQWQLPGKDTVIAIEEIGEAAFMIDSLLQQLADTGSIDPETPIIFGDFSAIPTEHGSTRGPEDGDASVYDILRQRYASHEAPILIGWPFSHGRWNLTLPLGVRVRVDPAARTMFVLEPVVE